MEESKADKLVEQLAAGFETLQDEYQKLFGQHQALERKLATAREQVSDENACFPALAMCILVMKYYLALDL